MVLTNLEAGCYAGEGKNTCNYYQSGEYPNQNILTFVHLISEILISRIQDFITIQLV